MSKLKQINKVIAHLEAKHMRVTVNKVVTASLFIAGGTLAGHEKEIKQAIRNRIKPAPLSGVPVIEITADNRQQIFKKYGF